MPVMPVSFLLNTDQEQVVRGKNRVSQMANKKIKTAIHLAALSVIKMKGELRDHYLKKTEEGKEQDECYQCR